MVADRTTGESLQGNAKRATTGYSQQLGSVSPMTWFVALMLVLALVVGVYAVTLTSGAMAANAALPADSARTVAETAQQ